MMRLIQDLPMEAPLRGRITSLLIAYGARIDLNDRIGRSILETEVAYLMRFPNADRTVLQVLVDSQLTVPPLASLSALGGSNSARTCALVCRIKVQYKDIRALRGNDRV